jgi:hypothetical protein
VEVAVVAVAVVKIHPNLSFLNRHIFLS